MTTATFSEKVKLLDELYLAHKEADYEVHLALKQMEIAREQLSIAIDRRDGLIMMAREVYKR